MRLLLLCVALAATAATAATTTASSATKGVLTKEAKRAVARPLSSTWGAGLIPRDGAAAPRSARNPNPAQHRQLSASATCPATPAVIAFSAYFYAYEEQQVFVWTEGDCQFVDCQGAYDCGYFDDENSVGDVAPDEWTAAASQDAWVGGADLFVGLATFEGGMDDIDCSVIKVSQWSRSEVVVFVQDENHGNLGLTLDTEVIDDEEYKLLAALTASSDHHGLYLCADGENAGQLSGEDFDIVDMAWLDEKYAGDTIVFHLDESSRCKNPIAETEFETCAGGPSWAIAVVTHVTLDGVDMIDATYAWAPLRAAAEDFSIAEETDSAARLGFASLVAVALAIVSSV